MIRTPGILVAALAFGLLGTAPASARVVSQTPVLDTQTEHVVEVKRGGHGWAKGNRGRHYGWSRGRGKALGRKRKFGF